MDAQKAAELQSLEGNLQNFLMQKQPFQMELNEINNAIEELKSSDGEVYKVISGIMLKSSKDKLVKELEEKKKISEMKIESIEKHEKLLEKNASELTKKISVMASKNKKNSK